MTDLSTLLEALDGSPVASLSDAELEDRLRSLLRLRDAVTAEIRSVAGEWDHRMVWAGDGARSGAAWLAHNTECSRGLASTELRVAKRLRTMPHLAAASASGALGAEKVAAISHAVDRDTTGQLTPLFAEHEVRLVHDAGGLSVEQTRTAVAYWRSCASDATATLDAKAQHDARELRLIPAFDGMVDLQGRLDAVSAAMLTNRLDIVMDRNYRAEHATLADGEIGRTATRRRADALVELICSAPGFDGDTGAESDGTRRPLPLLNVEVPLEALEDRSGRPATLPDGTPLPYDTLARLACEAGIAGVITRAGRLTIELGRTTYTPNRAQRRAVVRRDHHCVWAGCDAPAARCDVHHLWPWEHGGSTELWNLALVCRFHHHLVHEGGFRLLADAGGTLHAWRPDGTEIDAPPGHPPPRIDSRPSGTVVPRQWTAPGRPDQLPLGATAAGTAPPGGWDRAHPPDPDLDDLAYRRWQDHLVRQRVAALVAETTPTRRAG